jgi:hypothetical protein
LEKPMRDIARISHKARAQLGRVRRSVRYTVVHQPRDVRSPLFLKNAQEENLTNPKDRNGKALNDGDSV